jgi:tryptophan synthase beta chain
MRQQILEKEGRLPTRIIACIGGGSNAMGAFADFIPDPEVQLIGIEAGGRSLNVGDHSAALNLGTYGILHGSAQYVLQDEDGQVLPAHSIAAGLDYPGVGPEHCHLKDIGRARYEIVNDLEAVQAFRLLSQTEGIIPALESSHAVAGALKLKGEFMPEDITIINISGRGDKDCAEVQEIIDAGLLD